MDDKTTGVKATTAPESTGRFWTEQQLAQEMAVNMRTIRNWRTRRIIPSIKIGRVVRYERASVLAALARQTVQARAVA